MSRVGSMYYFILVLIHLFRVAVGLTVTRLFKLLLRLAFILLLIILRLYAFSFCTCTQRACACVEAKKKTRCGDNSDAHKPFLERAFASVDAALRLETFWVALKVDCTATMAAF